MSQDRPADPASSEDPAAEGIPADAIEPDDTEGHSMLTYELGLNVARERQRQAELASRDARRAASVRRRGIVDRLRRR